ncbi:MAG TPA: hypothetical protein VJM46_05065 [Candidatus Saccharimonadales bacterium]|nr:hypothetical protein [Candidatus Saccharimonadales bacterium]
MQENQPQQNKRRIPNVFIVIVIAVVMAVVGIGVGLLLASKGASQDQAKQNPGFTTAVTQLPAGYTIDPNSADRQDGALAYVAKNPSGSLIVISEQERPTDAKITKFVADNMTATKTLSGTTHPSVIGSSTTGGRFLSITLPQKWIMVSSSSATEAELTYIAQNLR